MGTIHTEVYDALKSIKVPDKQARAAAEALSQSDTELLRLEQRIEIMKRDIIITILGANGILFGLLKYFGS